VIPPDWTLAEQAHHRRVLAEAVGCAPDLPAPQPPPPPCAACQGKRHGSSCAGWSVADGVLVRCECRCRVGLGLTAFLDATAPEVADQLEKGVA